MGGGGETSWPNEIYRPADVLPAGRAEARVDPDRRPCHPKIPDLVDLNREPTQLPILSLEMDCQYYVSG